MLRSKHAIARVYLVLLSFGLPMASTAASPKEAELAEALDERLDLSLSGAAPREVFASFAKILDVDLHLDEEVERPITIVVSRTRVANVLDVLCDMADCEWHVEPGRLVVGAVEPTATDRAAEDPLDYPIDMSLREAALCETLRSFGKFTGYEVEVDPALCDKTLTIEAESLAVREVLDRICRLQACRWSVEDGERLVFAP